MIEVLSVLATIAVFCIGVVGVAVFGGMTLAVLGCTYYEEPKD